MPWIDLDEVNLHLNKDNPEDDEELEGFITAACAMIEDLKGHVEPVDVTEVLSARWIPHAGVGHPYYAGPPYGGYTVYPGRRYILELRQAPVASITSVGRYDGGTPTVIPAEDLETGVLGWLLRDTVLYLPTAGEYVITYTSGLNPIPGNYRMAALELVAHLWKTSQLNASTGGRPQMGAPDTDWMRGMAYALPFRVRELLGMYGTTANSTNVVIA